MEPQLRNYLQGIGLWPLVTALYTANRFFPRFRVISLGLCVASPAGCHSCDSVLQVDFSSIASQAGATLTNLMSHAQELVLRLRALQFDHREFVCLKFLVLFSLGEQRFFFSLLVHSTTHYFQMPNAGCLDVTDILHFLLGNEIFRLDHAFTCVLTRVLALQQMGWGVEQELFSCSFPLLGRWAMHR